MPFSLQFVITRFCALWMLMIMMAAPSMAQPSTWGITSLMTALAKNSGGVTTFTEKKFIAMLDAPLESSGELHYTAPNYLEKRTLKPKPESFVLNDGIITIQRGKKRHTLKLKRHPRIAIFIESIRGTLAGDISALERSYQLALTGNAEHWKLTLSPIDKRMDDILNQIVILGKQERINTIEIHQADGDYSIMKIEEVATP
ncbi:MAG TPA: outer membrane lipoprotein carrier protein LolA [Chromatiales bacterium]|nr:outer membrane lipoprotein carrier protein LolA [Chromatiales bacterium]